MNPVQQIGSNNPRPTEKDIAISNQLYDRGMEHSQNGAFQNLPEARLLFIQSALKGNANAMNVLGVMFQYGYGGSIDLTTAREMYTHAVRLGQNDAHVNLLCLNIMLDVVGGPYRFKKSEKL